MTGVKGIRGKGRGGKGRGGKGRGRGGKKSPVPNFIDGVNKQKKRR